MDGNQITRVWQLWADGMPIRRIAADLDMSPAEVLECVEIGRFIQSPARVAARDDLIARLDALEAQVRNMPDPELVRVVRQVADERALLTGSRAPR